MLRSRTGKFLVRSFLTGAESEGISGSGRISQRKRHCSEERVLAQISAVNSNILLGADDAHPGVQRQLTYKTA